MAMHSNPAPYKYNLWRVYTSQVQPTNINRELSRKQKQKAESRKQKQKLHYL